MAQVKPKLDSKALKAEMIAADKARAQARIDYRKARKAFLDAKDAEQIEKNEKAGVK